MVGKAGRVTHGVVYLGMGKTSHIFLPPVSPLTILTPGEITYKSKTVILGWYG